MDKSPSPRKMDHHQQMKPSTNPSGTLQVPPQKRSLSGRSGMSSHTSPSQAKSRASTRQSGLTNISNWTAITGMSTFSVRSSFYPSSGYPTTNPLAGAGQYPASGFPLSNLGYPGTSFGYPSSNYPGFPNFPYCNVPGVTGLQPFYPNSEFPASAFPGEIEQDEESQPYIGLYNAEADMGAYALEEYTGYPSGGYRSMDMSGSVPMFGSQTYGMPYPR